MASKNAPEENSVIPKETKFTKKQEYEDKRYEEITRKEETKNTLQWMVQIESGESVGNGIVIDRQQDYFVVATCKHLIKDENKITVSQLKIYENGFVGTSENKASLLQISDRYDLAFIKVMDAKELEQMPAIVDEQGEWEKRSLIGKDTYLFCFDTTNQFKEQSISDNKGVAKIPGYIWSYEYVPLFQEFMMIIKGYGSAGMSGCGVIDEDGKLIGILVGGEVSQESSKKEAELIYCLPSHVIMEVYHEYFG